MEDLYWITERNDDIKSSVCGELIYSIASNNRKILIKIYTLWVVNLCIFNVHKIQLVIVMIIV